MVTGSSAQVNTFSLDSTPSSMPQLAICHSASHWSLWWSWALKSQRTSIFNSHDDVDVKNMNPTHKDSPRSERQQILFNCLWLYSPSFSPSAIFTNHMLSCCKVLLSIFDKMRNIFFQNFPLRLFPLLSNQVCMLFLSSPLTIHSLTMLHLHDVVSTQSTVAEGSWCASMYLDLFAFT